MQLPVPQHIAAIVPYPPGKPMDELEREYGVTNAIKLASNENPWGPSPKAVAAIAKIKPSGDGLVERILEDISSSISEIYEKAVAGEEIRVATAKEV